MADGYSRSPFVLKGALVQMSAPLPVPIPIPNIIIFQYNPETVTRSFSPYDPVMMERATASPWATGHPLATQPVVGDGQPFDPTETFSVSLLLDATDALEEPAKSPLELVVGIADRLAALEMLMYPNKTVPGAGLLAVAASALGGAASGSANPDPRGSVPTTIFVWGPGRIVPVRITSFNVEEVQYNQLLYPHRAKASVGMRVLTSRDFPGAGTDADKVEYKIARFCYDFTFAQKQILALANIYNTVASVLDMAGVF
jgi:hypothetical protein